MMRGLRSVPGRILGGSGVGCAGFTLVELLVALAVLALVVWLVLPIAGSGRHGGGHALGEAVAQLRQARATAKREARAIEVTGLPGRDSPRQGAIVFYADGSSSGGEVSIGAAVLRVDRLSGRVSRVE